MPSFRLVVPGLVALALLHPHCAPAQGARPLTREEARRTALERAPRLQLAQGDTALAAATLRTARLLPDPTLGLSWSKSVPSYHVDLDVPLDLPWVRSRRIEAARQSQAGSWWRLAFERAGTALDVDTAYTRALASRDRAALSHRNALDADSLRRIAVLRRDAGDASELDVLTATIFAGQQRNAAAADSLAAEDALLALQALMGLPDAEIVVAPTDSLDPPTGEVPESPGTFVLVAAAEADVRAAQATTAFARADRFGTPSLIAGFERDDPGEPGTLPTIGLSLPLPLFNRNRGTVATADAERRRADATLAAIRIESATALARARRALRTAAAQVERDRALLDVADRVTTMSLTAYREGAATLAWVLEAQRNARDVRTQYIDDVAAAWIARGVVLLLSESASPSRP